MLALNIVEDGDSVEIPKIGYRDRVELNCQTAYNRSIVEKALRCGCFHCGSTFAGSDVTVWLSECDGEDSACCPFCGEDAVIVGTRQFPLSTALLSILFMEWFPEEYEAAKESFTNAPEYSNRDDYLRKGVPFRYERGEREFVGEVGLWVDSVFSASWNEEFDSLLPVREEELEFADAGGEVSVKACFDDEGCYTCEIKSASGNLLPYAPWSGRDQDLLLDLSNRYGDDLKGLIVDGGFGGRMRLYVECEAEAEMCSRPLDIEIDWMPGWDESQIEKVSKAYSEAMGLE